MKPFKSHRSQLGILRGKGLTVPTDGKPMRILEKENYYNVINGYKEPFLHSKKTATSDEKYKRGTKFSEIYALYKFDCELKSIFLKRILRVENHIKTAIAYNFSKKYSNKNHNCLLAENFDLNPLGRETREERYSNVMKLIIGIQNDIAKQLKKHGSVRHYMMQYGYIPLWVTVNILTLGTISYFYKYMKQPDKQMVSKNYSVSDGEFEIMVKILSIVRNICAHDERLYIFRSKDSIKNGTIHRRLSIPTNTNGYIYGKQDLFAVLIILKLLLSKSEFNKLVKDINHEIITLDKQLNVINISDILKQMGFVSDWKNIVRI